MIFLLIVWKNGYQDMSVSETSNKISFFTLKFLNFKNYGNGNIISAIELDIVANYIVHLFFFKIRSVS